MNCEQCNSGDNCSRCESIKFEEYKDWLIPFQCNVCQCRYFLCNICHSKQFDNKRKQKSIMVKRKVPRHIQNHMKELSNKRKRFTNVNEVRT